MITHELEMWYSDTPPSQEIRLALSSTQNLAKFLQGKNKPFQLMPVLSYELRGRNRLSYIQRIYGRYHKLIRKRDFDEMHLWALQKRKLKNI